MAKPAARFDKLPRATAYEQVADRIRTAILDKSLHQDARLPAERELASQFGVSRTTVREALRHLQAQGLLAARGRSSPMQPADAEAALTSFRESLGHLLRLRNVSLHELLELRLAIETAALVRAAQAPVAEHLAAARGALEVMAAARVTRAAFYEADVTFHAALVAASGNDALRSVMLAVKDAMRHHLEHALRERSFTELRGKVVDEHRGLLAAVERGDAPAVGALLRQHLELYVT